MYMKHGDEEWDYTMGMFTGVQHEHAAFSFSMDM
jgi:hypothetical protein